MDVKNYSQGGRPKADYRLVVSMHHGPSRRTIPLHYLRWVMAFAGKLGLLHSLGLLYFNLQSKATCLSEVRTPLED